MYVYIYIYTYMYTHILFQDAEGADRRPGRPLGHGLPPYCLSLSLLSAYNV